MLRRADAETAKTVARLVAEAHGAESARVRGLAEAVRASGDGDVVPEGATGYFEAEVDEGRVEAATEALGSLTRFVIYADSPVFAWFEDGKVYLRADEEVLRTLEDEGIEPSEAAETPDSVVAEMDEDG